jgi:hypothetical protein
MRQYLLRLRWLGPALVLLSSPYAILAFLMAWRRFGVRPVVAAGIAVGVLLLQVGGYNATMDTRE